MIAVDTSTLVAFLAGEGGEDVNLLREALTSESVTLPPMVLTEILSDPGLPPQIEKIVLELPRAEIRDGFWERAAETRRRILKAKLRARLGDCLIAQVCLDQSLAIVSRDKDFIKMARVIPELKIAP